MVVLLWLSCADEAVPIRLDEPDAWTPVAAEADPLSAHRPDDVACPVSTYGTEIGMFEVQTGACAYGAFAQPLVVDVRQGDRLVGTLWHDDLDAPEPSAAHVAVLLGDHVLHEATVAIPGPANVLPFDVAAPADVGAGALLGFHIHNHGFNSWRIAAIEHTRR